MATTTLGDSKGGTPVKKGRTKAKLLLVDDNQELSKVLQAHLIKEGYDVQMAKDGQTGLTLARKVTSSPTLIGCSNVTWSTDNVTA